jgi:hypothetical protein
LIIKPCRKSCVSRPVTIIIDGLDECDSQDIQQEILRLIGNAVYRQPLSIIFFIASRPESHLCETFSEPGLKGFHRPLNIEQSFEDVRKYLLDEFGRIHREHPTMAIIPFPWPASKTVEDLVAKSSGYFIYASTVIKFIDDRRFRPRDRLNIILGIKNSISASPFNTLDQLYHQILCHVPMDSQSDLLGVLAVIRAQFRLSISQIEQLLGLEIGDVRLVLRGLHSVIKLPEEDGYPWVHHASFLDFLDDPARSGPFHIGTSQCRTTLTYQILKALSYTSDDPLLKQNMSW